MTTPRLLSDRYELGDTLGYGGMSEVHRGLDKRLGRDVAVKVLRADLARDPQFQLRFRREAQNAAALNHPAIVAIYDTGEVTSDFGPLPYIVMEYVDGQTLREIVKTSGPMSQQRVIEVMADVCAALDFSHKHSIIHRDVKPANIMINRAGAVKVMDFGIARALGEGQNMTQTAAVIGTAQYLSPEQARGEAVDARSDVYAAGCVLFELLTGEPPFTGDTPVAVAYQHVREDPRSPSELNPQVTPQLDAIVLKALSKNPANRYQSSAEMRADLVRVRSGQQPLAPVVMSEDERTAMLNPRSTGQTRRINGAGATRYAPAPPPPAHYDDYGDYDDDPDRRRGRRIAIGIAAAVVVGLLALTGYLIFGGSPTTRQVEVPNVAGQQPEAARAALQAANLLATLQPVTSTVDEKGRVIGTDPAAGSQVPERSTVTLQVGNGPDQAAVPPLTGRTVAEAGPLLTRGAGSSWAPRPSRSTADAEPGRQDPLVDARRAARTCPPAPPWPSSSGSSGVATVAVAETSSAAHGTARPPSQFRRSGQMPTTRSAAGAGRLHGAAHERRRRQRGRGRRARTRPRAPRSRRRARSRCASSPATATASTCRTSGASASSRLRPHWPARASPTSGCSQESTNDPSEIGRVLDQSPSPGRSVSTDDQVTLTVGTPSGSGSSSSETALELTRPGRRPTTRVGRVRVLVVDNYDSFVYNLVQYLAQLGADTTVRRNDVVDLDELDDVDGVLISPGPGTPERAGASIDVIRAAARRALPLLGVCLGHQAIGAAWGGVVERAPELLHGKTSLVHHDGAGRARGPARPVRGHPLPLAVDPPRHRAGRAGGHRPHRERCGDGGAPPRAARRGCAVPPRVGAHRGRAPDARQLDGGGRAPRRGTGRRGADGGDGRGQRPRLSIVVARRPDVTGPFRLREVAPCRSPRSAGRPRTRRRRTAGRRSRSPVPRTRCTSR